VAVLLLRDHPRQERLDSVDGAPQIHVDHEAPIVVTCLCDRPRVRDARIVEHHVHGAEYAERLVGEVDDVVELAGVTHHAVRVDPVAAQPRHCLLQTGFIDVSEHQPGAAARELLCGGEADSARASGDDCRASLESVHGATLCGQRGPFGRSHDGSPNSARMTPHGSA
jgi:hypothetical protein